MTHKKFFQILDDLYGFGENGENAFGVKYYCQAHTFSFHIFKKEDAYHGKAVFDSDTYSFWFQDKNVRQQILEDIDVEINKVLTEIKLLNSNKS